METCKYGSGAGKRKPTAVKRKGVVCRAYSILLIFPIMKSECLIRMKYLSMKISFHSFHEKSFAEDRIIFCNRLMMLL